MSILHGVLLAAALVQAAFFAQPQVPVQIPMTPPAPAPTTPSAPAPPATTAANPLTQGIWQWLRTEYGDDTTLTASDPSRYTIMLSPDGRLSVQADCNRAVGTYTLNGPQLTFQLGPTTLAACGPDSQDRVFMRDLGQVVSYVLDGGLLHLNMRLDSGNMVFSPQPPASLSGFTWRVTGYNNGRQAVTSPVPGTVLTAVFGEDGTISGDSGCNNYTGPFTVAGSSMTIGPLASTRRACLSDEANAQEQAFLAALAATRTYELVGERLTLRDDSGATQVQLVRPAIQPTPGGSEPEPSL
jgi:heat shock protein HslJ